MVAEYERSRLTQEAFAKQRGIKVGTLRQWLYRRERTKAGGAKEPTFQEVSLGDLSSSSSWAAEISWPQGPTIRLSGQSSPAWAGELIKTVQES